MSTPPKNDWIAFTGQVVAAYVAKNRIPTTALPDLIRIVYGTFIGLAQEGSARAEDVPMPAVPIKRSVFPDYIVCLEDGRKLKTLKRHLHGRYGLSPDQYRQRWNLPQNYPMTAPNYAARRSELARQNGLGQRPKRPG